MRLSVLMLLLCLSVAVADAFAPTFSGLALQPIAVEVPKSSGLEAVYVLSSAQGVECSIAYSSPTPPHWYAFSNLGGGFAQEIASVNSNGVSTIKLTDGDMGYIVEVDSERKCFWVTDYSGYEITVEALLPVSADDCSLVTLNPVGAAPRINYFSVNGQQLTLNRQLRLTYFNLEYSDTDHQYKQIEASKTLDFVVGNITLAAPLCQTAFTLAGDRFLTVWGREIDVTSEMVVPKAVECKTIATQAKRDNDNERDKGASENSLGGSAPVDVTFSAAVTDAAVFTEWQFSTQSDFNDIYLRAQALDTDYSFREMGTFYVRFACADASGVCETFSDTYTVSVGESSLLCPNAFSPGASEGTNDVWKVSYHSIVEFECHIFDRYGKQMTQFSNPAEGWDGKYKGKLVPAGVYYYVIKARGADGKAYNLAGDINIVNYR